MVHNNEQNFKHSREFHERKMNYESCCENGDRF